jgi:N utilization substance protein B
VIGSRTRSREIALQVLYSCDQTPAPEPQDWELTLEDAEISPEVRAFARELVSGVLARRGELDALIAAAADNWELSRLAAVDRNVLRLAVHELTGRPDIPAKVSINEAIELGKRFSTAQSGAFVNGILDRVRRDLGLPIEDAPPRAGGPRAAARATSSEDAAGSQDAAGSGRAATGTDALEQAE